MHTYVCVHIYIYISCISTILCTWTLTWLSIGQVVLLIDDYNDDTMGVWLGCITSNVMFKQLLPQRRLDHHLIGVSVHESKQPCWFMIITILQGYKVDVLLVDIYSTQQYDWLVDNDYRGYTTYYSGDYQSPWTWAIGWSFKEWSFAWVSTFPVFLLPLHPVSPILGDGLL